MSSKNTNKGFTLIELVIVLAIAALIIAGILLAVRGAQQSRRDSQRRSDAGAMGALVEESAGNHGGNYPAQAGGATVAAFNAALTQKFPTAPDGNAYTFSTAANAAMTAATACPAPVLNTVNVRTNGTRNWMVCVGLESGDVFRATNF